MDDNSANALRLTHHFAGPPALVWAIWTRPDLIRSWFGSSHGFRAHDIAVDLRPGGNWSLRNDTTGTVTRVHADAVPGDLTPIDGGEGVQFVLEIAGGLAGKLGIAPGTVLRHPAIPDATAAWPCEG